VSVEVVPAPLLRPWWQRARIWIAIGLVLLLGAIVLAAVSTQPGRALDPASARSNGSKALAHVLAHYGVSVTATSAVATAVRSEVVVVASPDDYSDDQLRELAAAAARVVLVGPGTRALAALSGDVQPDRNAALHEAPGCAFPGAQAAGPVDFPDDTIPYAAGPDAERCYGGAVVLAGKLAVVGSLAVLTNARLGDPGVAALDVNVISDDRRYSDVAWLLPGADAKGSGPASIWDLFPPAAYRAFWWLVACGVLLALWRARRLGGVVAEELPVVVRAAELVEGHGRLYARAGARDRAAAALRAAAVRRLAHRLGLPRGTPAVRVASAAAPLVGGAPADVLAVLDGPAPADDAALARLARDLDQLEARLQEGDVRR
jgi:hypothetical protein